MTAIISKTIASPEFSNPFFSTKKNRPTIIAFIFIRDREYFLKNWRNHSSLSTTNVHFVCIENFHPDHHVTNNHNDKFTFLGVKALEISKANDICTLGGGQVVYQEYQRTANTHNWHFFPITRLTRFDGGGEGKQKWKEESSLLVQVQPNPKFLVYSP